MDSVSASSAASTAMVVRGADQNTAVAATLLKKITQADKNLVDTLLPPPPASPGGLDIRA